MRCLFFLAKKDCRIEIIFIFAVMKNDKPNFLYRIWRFYYDGFREMKVGKTLWLIIFIKLFIMFAILKLFFFQPTLKGTDEEKAEQVRNNITFVQ